MEGGDFIGGRRVEWTGRNSRSLGCARDEKWRVVTFIGGRQVGWTEENSRSLRCARDDKVEGGDFDRGPSSGMDRKKQQVPRLRFHGTPG